MYFSIGEVVEDTIASDGNSAGVIISNLAQLQDAQIKRSIGEGQPLRRGVRYSLTCRDVGRVSSLNTRR